MKSIFVQKDDISHCCLWRFLKKSGVAVSPNDHQLPSLIHNMWQTLDYADGVGLAAPQINKNWNLFIVDSTKVYRNLLPMKLINIPMLRELDGYLSMQVSFIIAKGKQKWKKVA